MKNLISTLLVFTIYLATNQIFAQDIPSVNVKTLGGETFNTQNLHNDGKPMIISFWATWCKPCVQELNAIAEVYPEWQEETGVKLIAISIDDSRNLQKVAPFVKTQEWTYEVYSDVNGDFKRAMNVNFVPHTFLIDGKGNIIDQHTSYKPGDEEDLFEEVKALVK